MGGMFSHAIIWAIILYKLYIIYQNQSSTLVMCFIMLCIVVIGPCLGWVSLLGRKSIQVKSAVPDIVTTLSYASACEADVNSCLHAHSAGDELLILTGDMEAKVELLMAQNGPSVYKGVADTLLDADMQPWIDTLSQSSFPDGTSNEFLPAGCANEVLVKIAAAVTAPSEPLANLAAMLGRRAQANSLYILEHMSLARTYGAKVLLRTASLVPVLDLQVQDCEQDSEYVLAMQHLQSEFRKVRERLIAVEDDTSEIDNVGPLKSIQEQACLTFS